VTIIASVFVRVFLWDPKLNAWGFLLPWSKPFHRGTVLPVLGTGLHCPKFVAKFGHPSNSPYTPSKSGSFFTLGSKPVSDGPAFYRSRLLQLVAGTGLGIAVPNDVLETIDEAFPVLS
jgi:hypothetical protein